MSGAASAGLNDGQRRAVEHGAAEGPAARPLLVIAGAGSGKTATLAHRVARLMADGADPGHILLLTFSRRAAVEINVDDALHLPRKVRGPNRQRIAHGRRGGEIARVGQESGKAEHAQASARTSK